MNRLPLRYVPTWLRLKILLRQMGFADHRLATIIAVVYQDRKVPLPQVRCTIGEHEIPCGWN